MRFLMALLVVMASFSLTGCRSEREDSESLSSEGQPAAQSIMKQAKTPGEAGNIVGVSLEQVDAVQASSVAAERKIIRNANLVLELDSPSEGMSKAAEIAGAHGGFVVTSEFAQNGGRSQNQPSQVVTVIIRIPSTQFTAALESIRKIGSRVLQEKVTGQDVTEEYLDLEARIRTKKALEDQILEIMKQARKVSEALEVQTELANVRTEIEQLEGRRRFLENQSGLSTISVTLQMPVPIVAANTSSFVGSIKQSIGDGVDIGASIILGLIRMIIVMVPVALFIILPIGLLARLLRRRFSWPKNPADVPLNNSNQ